MDIKQMLKEYNTLGKRIMEMQQELNELKQLRPDNDGLKAHMLTSRPGVGKITDITFQICCENVDKWDRKIQELAKEINELIDRQYIIEKAMKELNYRERKIIELRYIIGLSWERVAVEANYAWAQCHRLHGSALEKMRKMIQNDTNYVVS